MKFIKTINWSLINLEEVTKIDYVNESNNADNYYGYFHLKNGDKLDCYEYPNFFNFEVDDPKSYLFCAHCCMKINELLLNDVLNMADNCIYDVSENEDKLWEIFINWAKQNKDKLSVKP
jgi:hypothetical protein